MASAGRFVDLLILGHVWIAIALLVNPAGNFPLNDDWSFGRAVHTPIECHTFELIEHTVDATHHAGGVGRSVHAPIFGVSFTVLRASTLALGLMGNPAGSGSGLLERDDVSQALELRAAQ
jgi:hypothetical protein